MKCCCWRTRSRRARAAWERNTIAVWRPLKPRLRWRGSCAAEGRIRVSQEGDRGRRGGTGGDGIFLQKATKLTKGEQNFTLKFSLPTTEISIISVPVLFNSSAEMILRGSSAKDPEA